MTPKNEIAELLKAASVDPALFAREILGVDLNISQQRWFRLVTPVDGWKWPRKLIAHVAANQIGKTLGLAILIIWAGTYKIGTDPSDKQAWFNSPYIWFHVAPTQQQAYHPLNDIRLLIKGAHPAQKLKFRLPAGMVREAKQATYYDGLEFASGASAQFRTTENKASALQGYRAAAISIDEAAFEPYLTATVNETLQMRLIASGGPLLAVSTPNGMNDWYDICDAIQAAGIEVEPRVWINGDSALVWSVITDNVGYGLTQAEVDRMEINLDPATKEQQLRGTFLNPPEAFFTPPGAILRSFPTGMRELPKEVGPKPGHRYIAFWDPSVASDPTACIVLDVTSKPWRGVYFRHWKTPMQITELIGEITKVHLLYNSAQGPYRQSSHCVTAYDATSMGGVIISQLLQHIYSRRALNWGGPDKKIKTLINARAALSKQDVLLPASWTQLRSEVLNYKLKDDKLKQDACMALVGAIFCGEGVGDGKPSHRFDVSGRVTPTWANR